MTTIGTMRALGATRGAVRVEDVFHTDVRDLWDACTTPVRLARWIAEVSGDLRVGGMIEATFTSTWTGPMRIDVCDAPHHLRLTMAPGTDEEAELEAWLSEDGDKTLLTVEHRGLPRDKLHFYGAGLQVHLEDLARSLALDGTAHPDGWSASEPSPAWRVRWVELTSAYAAMTVE